MSKVMRAAIAAWIFCTGILGQSVEANAQSMPKEVASRVEIYAIPSLTISDQQFLTGDANGKRSPSPANFASRKAPEACPSWC